MSAKDNGDNMTFLASMQPSYEAPSDAKNTSQNTAF